MEFMMLNEGFLWESDEIDNLKMFKKRYGTCAVPSDFALSQGTTSFYNEEIKKDVCEYWVDKLVDNEINNAYVVDRFGDDKYENVNRRHVAVRPAFFVPKSSNISKIGILKDKDVVKVKYGEYPQNIAEKNISEELESLFKNNLLTITGKKYLVDSNFDYKKFEQMKNEEILEYQYKGEKYIRSFVKPSVNESNFSNGEKLISGEFKWFKVDSVQWYYFKEKNLMLAKDAMIGGFQYDNIKKFLKNNFKNEIKSSDLVLDEKINEQIKYLESLSKSEEKTLNYDEPTPEEQLEAYVENDISVFIHGLPGDGKTARVRQLDPDLTEISFLTATPETINGKSIVKDGKIIDIPPQWYTDLCDKCKKDPNKKHILFLDELTNGSPALSALGYDLILEKRVNKKWKLPDDVRIVAAGNDVENSSIAYEMPEPLFSRMAHVYIKTTPKNWLKWACSPENSINPYVISFIAKNPEYLRTEYNGKDPFANPRNWEKASQIFYKTLNPYFIGPAVGDEIAKKFRDFCYEKRAFNSDIELIDVLNNNWSFEQLEKMNIDQKYAIVIKLIPVEIENLTKVRNFISVMNAPELLEQFDDIWAGEDPKRQRIINNLAVSKERVAV